MAEDESVPLDTTGWDHDSVTALERRKRRGEDAIRAHSYAPDGVACDGDDLYNLLTDLMHWAYATGRSFDVALARAKVAALAEWAALGKGSGDATALCDRCGERYDVYGDGWNGLCPNCADREG